MIHQLTFDDQLNDPVVRVSSEAGITLGTQFYGAFQRHSYVARVQFSDGYVVLQALHTGAARYPASHWTKGILYEAKNARKKGLESVVWDD